MDLFNVNGLPLHALLVHVVVVLVPVTALCVLLAAAWPTARRRLGILIALMGLVLIGLVPLTMAAGQWLKERVFRTPLIETHADLGNALWPWSLALGLLGIGTWLWYFLADRRARSEPQQSEPQASEPQQSEAPRSGGRRAVAIILVLLAIGIGGMATYQTVLIGESGSRAIWEGLFTENPR
ncbi:hypothetical protein [Cryobacterium tagatosivorans]|uniref:Uncharacterized protein n=1 Tax=Cryobacterium tagatosivorans TaxID=1259199 RepID=A0A4R8UAU0_9MICO|nr:hypothetical protein [Cryobacterium tagatosivorans]TFB46518.1 hypothetical protein E3O23_17175 [Cryobacterium tagatosivorans]